ncbi:MAG: TonB family protein [Alphaproteobacteria bacterium]|nr:TonB family protein [Alphaproteobacteria bacterium]
MIGPRSRAPVRLHQSDRALSDRTDGTGRALAFSALAASLAVHWAIMSTSNSGGALSLGASTALKTSIQIAAVSNPADTLPPAPPRHSPHPTAVQAAQADPLPQPMTATVPTESPTLAPVEITDLGPQPITTTVPIAPPVLEPVRITEEKPAKPPFQPMAKPAEPPRPEPAIEPAPKAPTEPVAKAIAETPARPVESARSDTVQSATADPVPVLTRETGAAAGGAPAADPVLVTEPRFRVPPTPPAYPPVARRRNEEGTVVLRALVSPGGDTQRIEIWQSSGFYRLDDAARAAVEDWHFEPARKSGLAVASWVQVPIRFRLD